MRYIVLFCMIFFISSARAPVSIGSLVKGVVQSAVNAVAQAVQVVNKLPIDLPAGTTLINSADYTTFGWKSLPAASNNLVLTFNAKATTDIHIALKYDVTANSYIEIPLGGWTNGKSVIRNIANGVLPDGKYDIVATGPAHPIPDTANFVTYCLSVANGTLTIISKTSTGAVATAATVTNDLLKKTFTAYSFRSLANNAATWQVQSPTLVQPPFFPGDIVAFKLADGAYLHSYSDNNLYISGVDQGVNIFLHRTHFQIASTTLDASGNITGFTMQRLYSNNIATFSLTGGPSRLKVGGSASDSVTFGINAYDATASTISLTAGAGLIVQRDRTNYDARKQAPPAVWDYAACKAGGDSKDYTFKLIKITDPYKVFYSEANVDSLATIGNNLKATDMKDKLPLFKTALGVSGLEEADYWYLTQMLALYVQRGIAFPEWATLVVSGTTSKASDFTQDLLNSIYRHGPDSHRCRELAYDMSIYLTYKDYSSCAVFAGLTARLDKLNKINALMLGITSDFLSKATLCAILMVRVLPSLYGTWEANMLHVDDRYLPTGDQEYPSMTDAEKAVIKSITAQAFLIKANMSAADQAAFDKFSKNVFEYAGLCGNTLWNDQLQMISMIMQKLTSLNPAPAGISGVVSRVSVLFSSILTQHAYSTLSEDQKALVRSIFGYAQMLKAKNTALDISAFFDPQSIEGGMTFVTDASAIQPDSRAAYFSTKDIPFNVGTANPMLCVMRRNGQYLKFTGTADSPAWSVAPSAGDATQFKISPATAASVWSSKSAGATVPVSITMVLPGGEVPLKCVAPSRAAQLGLKSQDILVRPGVAGTPSDAFSLKLVNVRYWLCGASQPTTSIAGSTVPMSSWLYRLDGVNASFFTAADPAKSPFFVTVAPGTAAPSGFVDMFISLEAAPAQNAIKTAFLAIPPLETYVLNAKIDLILDEMYRVAHLQDPSESESLKFAQSGKVLGKKYASLTSKQQAKLLACVLA